jgi:hypothetical protein
MLHLKKLLERITRFCDHVRGARTTTIVAINNHPDEMYHAYSGDQKISIYCVETIYEIRFEKWWVSTEHHYVYRVYGVCDVDIPSAFAEAIGKAFYIGMLLPKTASRADQKKAAIHAYVNMIAAEITLLHKKGSF